MALSKPITYDWSPNYAGICVDENAVVTVIPLIESFVIVDVFDTNSPNKISTPDQANNRIIVGAAGDYDVFFSMSSSSATANNTFKWYVFERSASGTTITGATQANPVVLTVVGHPFSNGEDIAVAGVGGMVELNDRIFKVANAATDTVELQNDAATGINGTAFTPYTTGGVASLTARSVVTTKRRFAAVDVGAGGGGDIATLSEGSFVDLCLKCITGAVNHTHDTCCLSIRRAG